MEVPSLEVDMEEVKKAFAFGSPDVPLLQPLPVFQSHEKAYPSLAALMAAGGPVGLRVRPVAPRFVQNEPCATTKVFLRGCYAT